MERSLALIKPDAVRNKKIGSIINHIEKESFGIIGMEMLKLTKERAQAFYAVHKERPFFNDLVEFMISGPIVAIALEKENAVEDWRKAMGATDPADAEDGTVRKLYGTSKGENAVHGSDSLHNAKQEISFYFPELY